MTVRMKWPYFQSLKNIRSTACKALNLLARLDPAQSRRKVARNLLFSAKVACFLAIFD